MPPRPGREEKKVILVIFYSGVALHGFHHIVFFIVVCLFVFSFFITLLHRVL